ncbi:MAG: hypothetical protein AAF489_14755 [Bacteroidota bacterium]
MQSKGYFSILFVILALIGISWEHTSKPNQEVVVQFNNSDVSCDEAQNAIAIVKLQLQGIGVENIQVVEEAGGRLKITYYSNMDVAVVKSIISDGEKLELSRVSFPQDEKSSELPSSEDSVSYELNVSELHKPTNSNVDGDGFILELKSNHDRYVPPVVYYTFSEIAVRDKNRIEKIAYAVHRNMALVIDTSSHNIPEVRAGPTV